MRMQHAASLFLTLGERQARCKPSIKGSREITLLNEIMEEELQESVEKLQNEKRQLEATISAQQAEIQTLKAQLSQFQKIKDTYKDSNEGIEARSTNGGSQELSTEQIERYSRQLLLHDGFGVEGQRKLLSSSVLVIGAGGIGSTVLLYLAASGVGKISVVDFDQVDRSNLHRQVIHKDENVGMNKAISACRAVKDLNPTIECIPITEALTQENAISLVSGHTVVVDASDNPMTRYLINDACVLANKPLVSGSAIGTEGQLTVYNYDGGPCYRCLYPKPNATEGCKSCSDSGVLGPVPGLIGILQSVEALKVLTGFGTTMKDRLLMYDSLNCSFINIKKPPKSAKCSVCGESPTITSMKDSWNATQMCRGPNVATTTIASLSVQPTLAKGFDISCKEYAMIHKRREPHVLLDVRVPRQFEMCSLEGAVNIPLANLPQELDRVAQLSQGSKPVYCLCRRGIFSVEATRILSQATKSHPDICSPKNILGGLQAWSEQVDSSFPKY